MIIRKSLEIDGWTPASKRGAVSGVGLANVKSGYQYVVGLKSAQAQYWATAGTGTWKISKVLPGSYTLNVYKGVRIATPFFKEIVLMRRSRSSKFIPALSPSLLEEPWR